MAIRRIAIDYTVYSPEYKPSEGKCLDFRTLERAIRAAKSLGIGSSIHRNFNQRDKNQLIADWWQARIYWVWDGQTTQRVYDRSGKPKNETPPLHPAFLISLRRRRRST